MQDLTEGSIPRHIVKLSIPVAVGMVFQTMYVLVDLYFVGRLGDVAIAGVSSAGNVQFLIMAITQILGVGTMVLIAQASGRKDRTDANLIFNQSLGLAGLGAVTTLVLGYGLAGRYMATLAADEATMSAGMTYLFWFLPGLALQFALISMGVGSEGHGYRHPHDHRAGRDGGSERSVVADHDRGVDHGATARSGRRRALDVDLDSGGGPADAGLFRPSRELRGLQPADASSPDGRLEAHSGGRAAPGWRVRTGLRVYGRRLLDDSRFWVGGSSRVRCRIRGSCRRSFSPRWPSRLRRDLSRGRTWAPVDTNGSGRRSVHRS